MSLRSRRRAPRRKAASGAGGGPYRWRGQWRGYISTGIQRDGRPGRQWFYGATESECLDKMERFKRELDDRGGSLPEEKQTLAQWSTHWLGSVARRVQPRTVEIRRTDLARVGRRLMNAKLERITPLLIEKELLAIADDVSADAANKVRATLRACLQEALEHGLIPSNPARSVKRLAHEVKEPVVWTSEQVRTFIEATGEIITRVGRSRTWQEPATQFHPLFYTALTTGARVGELLALDWSDLEGKHLSISKTWSGQELKIPKTKSAVRVLTLPADTLEVLKAHRERLAFLGVPGGVMFPTIPGNRLWDSNVRRSLRQWSGIAGVPVITPHEMRHTFASMAIAGGMSPVDLARQLGHKDASFTLRTYTHFFERSRVRHAPSLLQLMEG